MAAEPLHVEAKTNDKAFVGWNEEKQEEAWTVYVSTDWSLFQNELLLDQVSPETSVRGISEDVEAYRDIVTRVVQETNEGKILHPPKDYVNLLLAMMQVLSDGSPDLSDPCAINVYFEPEGKYTAYSSIEYLYSKLLSAFRWHNNNNAEYAASIYDMDRELKAVIQTVMYGRAYGKVQYYSVEDSIKFYEENKETLSENADPNFAEKVASYYKTTTLSYDFNYDGTVTDTMSLVAEYARTNHSTYPCTMNWCAAWVQGVYEYVGLDLYGNAIDMWNWYKDKYPSSTDMSNIPPGAYVCGSGTGSMGALYGHVGIYIGNGLVANNIGYHSIEPINSWISWQTANCQGHVGWIGWILPIS